MNGWDLLRRPIWLFDPVSCRGLYANAAAVELWGAESEAELLARDFSQLSPAVRTRTERLARLTVERGVIHERWSFYPRGQPVTVQAAISSFPLADGRAVLLFEAAPAEVEQAELRAVEALRHTSSLISLFDSTGRTLFTNPAAFAAYGEDTLGFADRFEEDGDGAAALTDVLGGGVLGELRQVRTVQGPRWHYLDARRVVDPVTGDTSVLLSERDVTAQVEAERALGAARERAEVAEAKQRFLANMSHELRTPLTSVLGFAGLLKASGLEPAQTAHLDRISDAGEHLLVLINDVIDLAEIDAGQVRLDPAPFDPSALLSEAVARIAPRAAAKDLTVALDLPPEAPVLIGDAARLETVVSHYLTNAVKFTERGGIVARLSLEPAADGAVAATFTVTDSGPGIDGATRPRLFRRFSQADDSVRKRHGGTGLGLAISRELIALMDGEVGVDSVPGQGAAFWARVVMPAQADAAAGDDEDQDAGPLAVLYADDQEPNRVLVQALLASQGHACDLVCDGAQAVQAVRAKPYDLVLMDIQMPGQDGLSATLEIRAAGYAADTPIIALTANTLSEQRQAYADAGMSDCIAKPVNPVELLTKVAYWGALRRSDPQRSVA